MLPTDVFLGSHGIFSQLCVCVLSWHGRLLPTFSPTKRRRSLQSHLLRVGSPPLSGRSTSLGPAVSRTWGIFIWVDRDRFLCPLGFQSVDMMTPFLSLVYLGTGRRNRTDRFSRLLRMGLATLPGACSRCCTEGGTPYSPAETLEHLYWTLWQGFTGPGSDFCL